MLRSTRVLPLLLALSVCAPVAGAQTAQKLSIQGSGLFAQLYGKAFEDIKDGIGGEAQLRYTPGVWSFGFGVQYTQHGVSEGVEDVFDKVKLAGVFFEPRFVIDIHSASVAPYLSGRFAFSKMTFVLQDGIPPQGASADLSEPTGPTINGGGGLLFRLGDRANLDIGATIGYTKFDDIRLRLRNANGVEVLDETFKVGNGTNAVFRVGLAIGLGG